MTPLYIGQILAPKAVLAGQGGKGDKKLAKEKRVVKEGKMLAKGKRVAKEEIKQERMLVTVVVCGLYMLSKVQPLSPIPPNQPMYLKKVFRFINSIMMCMFALNRAGDFQGIKQA